LHWLCRTKKNFPAVKAGKSWRFGLKGYSVRNLKYMKRFATEYADLKFVQWVVAQISWRNNITLMEKVKDIETRKWYIAQNVKNGWNKAILGLQQAHGNQICEGRAAL
jgi:predicted nuclease of restriction endonuclease-like (RecB) superfamily